MAQRKKLARRLLVVQPLLVVKCLVANQGWVACRVKAASRRRRGPKARLYRTGHPAILGHRGGRLPPTRQDPAPSLRGFAPPVTTGAVNPCPLSWRAASIIVRPDETM